MSLQQFQGRLEGIRQTTFGPGNTCAWTDNQGGAHTSTIDEFYARLGGQRASRPGATLTLTIPAGGLGNCDDLNIIGRPYDLAAWTLLTLGESVPQLALGQEAARAGAVPTG